MLVQILTYLDNKVLMIVYFYGMKNVGFSN